MTVLVSLCRDVQPSLFVRVVVSKEHAVTAVDNTMSSRRQLGTFPLLAQNGVHLEPVEKPL